MCFFSNLTVRQSSLVFFYLNAISQRDFFCFIFPCNSVIACCFWGEKIAVGFRESGSESESVADALSMGKHSQHQDPDVENPDSTRFFYNRYFSALSGIFNLRCVLVLILSAAVLLFGLFSLLPLRTTSESNTNEQISLTAPAQAYFRLQKPFSLVVPQKPLLEKDISNTVDLPDTEVTILSIDRCGESNCTDVRFAVSPAPNDSVISQESLNSLRQSFAELFTKQSNLSLVTSRLGQPIGFQVVKFHGGITVARLESHPISGVVEILFDFTLNISISQVQDSLIQMKEQLKSRLRLKPYESVHIEMESEEGSTIEGPVRVEASVRSSMAMGITLLQQRLKELTHFIYTSANSNLGLDPSLFGTVYTVTLSTFNANAYRLTS